MTKITLASLKEKFEQGEISKVEFTRDAEVVHSNLFDYVELMSRTDVKEIHITADGVVFCIGEDDMLLSAPAHEARVAPLEILNFDQYEPHEKNIITCLAANANHILDVGANIGFYSVYIAAKNISASIYAFEPLPDSFCYLQKNIALNNLGARVHTFNIGLSDKNSSANFFIAPYSGTNASLENVAATSDAKKVVGFTSTMDDWCANYKVNPDLIKCDVEGAELLVFKGAARTLSFCQPVIFSELLRKWAHPFGYHPNDMLNYLSEFGYICLAVGENGVSKISEVTEETIETNYAFLHKEKHLDLIVKLKG